MRDPARRPNDLWPWERPIPQLNEYDDWWECDGCGTTWKKNLPGMTFAKEWRLHLWNHMLDNLH